MINIVHVIFIEKIAFSPCFWKILSLFRCLSLSSLIDRKICGEAGGHGLPQQQT
jgi:hypothetical protein